jgi:hypothetical protein
MSSFSKVHFPINKPFVSSAPSPPLRRRGSSPLALSGTTTRKSAPVAEVANPKCFYFYPWKPCREFARLTFHGLWFVEKHMAHFHVTKYCTLHRWFVLLEAHYGRAFRRWCGGGFRMMRKAWLGLAWLVNILEGGGCT